jgi:hypothetical protein
MLKNQQLDKYYEELFDMFATPGWAHFMEYMRTVREDTVENGWAPNPVPGMTLGEVLIHNRGVIYNLNSVLAFQDTHVKAYEDLEAEEAEQDE